MSAQQTVDRPTPKAPPAPFTPPATEFEPGPPADGLTDAERAAREDQIQRENRADDDAAAETRIKQEQYQPSSPIYPPREAMDPSLAPDAQLAERERDIAERERILAEREENLKAWIAEQREGMSKLTDRDVEGMIVGEYAVRGVDAFKDQHNLTDPAIRALECTTIVVMVLRNGYPIVGTGVCASPENYDFEAGKKEARAEAIAKLWLVAEHAARNRLMGLEIVDPPDYMLSPREVEERRRLEKRQAYERKVA